MIGVEFVILDVLVLLASRFFFRKKKLLEDFSEGATASRNICIIFLRTATGRQRSHKTTTVVPDGDYRPTSSTIFYVQQIIYLVYM